MTNKIANQTNLVIEEKAARMWAEMEQNEKAGVRIGIFPAKKMLEAKEQGYDLNRLCVCLMDQARSNGGMIS